MTPNRFVFLVVVIGVLFLWGVHHSMSGPAGESDAVAEERARNAGPSDSQLIGEAEYAIEQQMRDPGSTQFRNVYLRTVADGRKVVCGEVNARNGFGGYTGFERFIGTGRAAFLESQMDAKSFALTWKTLCL